MTKRFFTIILVNIILLIVFIVYYSKRNKELNNLASYQKKIELTDSLKWLTFRKKDTIAYNKLRSIYLDKPNEGEFLFYSIVLANRSHYPQAYFDVYHELRFIEKMEKNKIYSSKETKILMIDYLVKGAKLGHRQSIYELGKLYIEGKDFPQDITLGKKLMLSSGLAIEKDSDKEINLE